MYITGVYIYIFPISICNAWSLGTRAIYLYIYDIEAKAKVWELLAKKEGWKALVVNFYDKKT